MQVQQEMIAAGPATRFSARRFTYADLDANDANASTGPDGKRKPLTLFRIKSGLGQVHVQPVAGAVNGAQFSLGF